MKLLLFRDVLAPDFTLGRLTVDGDFFCYTLEDTCRFDGKKIPGKTCIPEGTYELAMTYSPKYAKRGKPTMPRLMDVPGFKGILLHPGNTHEDTEGCILVGMKRDVDAGTLSDSRIAFNSLYASLSVAHVNGEACEIAVINRFEEKP